MADGGGCGLVFDGDEYLSSHFKAVGRFQVGLKLTTDADVTLAAAGGCLGSLGGHFDCWLVVRYGRASEC